MSFRVSFDATIVADNRTLRNTVVEEYDNAVGPDRFGTGNPIPAAKTGELTTRTNNTEGTLTMDTGHGILTGDRLDLYWEGGSRRGITVGTVAGDSVPLTDSGAGDNLPAAETEITAMVPEEEAMVFEGDDLLALVADLRARGTIVIAESDDTELLHIPFETGSNEAFHWRQSSGVTNPLATESAAKVFISQAGSEATTQARARAFFDS